MVNQKAPTVAAQFVNEVISKYGAPENVLTDQETDFFSLLIKSICEQFKINQLRTTSYHPQTDGLVERFNRTLCDMLACYVNEEPEKWDTYLPFVTLAYNSTEHSSLKQTPFYLFFGREPTLPNEHVVSTRYRFTENHNEMYKQRWQLALESARKNLEKAQSKQKEYYDSHSKLTIYNVNDSVLLKSPPVTGKFNNRWLGPYIIIRRISSLTYEIQQTGSNRRMIVHINRLKKDPTTREPTIVEKPVENNNSEGHNNTENKQEKEKGNQIEPSTVTSTSPPFFYTPPLTNPTQPKRRGRPPKHFTLQTTAQQIESEKQDLQQIPLLTRPRGRPPKNSMPQAITTDTYSRQQSAVHWPNQPNLTRHQSTSQLPLAQNTQNLQRNRQRQTGYQQMTHQQPEENYSNRYSRRTREPIREEIRTNSRYNLRTRTHYSPVGAIRVANRPQENLESAHRLRSYEIRPQSRNSPNNHGNVGPIRNHH